MNKFEKGQKILQELNYDGWLTICSEDNDVHSNFLLGLESHARHYIYIGANGKHYVLAAKMEAPMIERSLKDLGVEAKVISYGQSEQLKSLLISIIDKPKIALNYGEMVISPNGSKYADHVRLGDYFSVKSLVPNTEFVSAAPIIYNLRSVKTSEEIEDLRNVCKATLEILETIPDWVQKGMTENEIKAKLQFEYMKLGKLSFEAIVATGPHAADPHHNSSNKKIEAGALLIDSGMQIDQMCSDITWMYWVGRSPSEQFIQAYQVLYESKQEANKYYVSGTPNYLPAVKCREYLAEKGYDHKKLFFHGLGHSLGFQAHDVGTNINTEAPEDRHLKENMIYTNEPGLYWRGKWGIRLEDDIIIGKEKCEQLTYNHKEPIVI